MLANCCRDVLMCLQEKHSLLDLATTFGVTLPGALTLHNYPM